MRLEVALVADPDSPFGEMAGDDWKTRYQDRRSVIVDVPGHTSIAAVLESAAQMLQLRPPEGHHFTNFSASYARLAFYRPEDEEGVHREIWQLGELAVVDRHGHAVFGVHDNRAITVDQLVRSAEAGLIDGDPLRPYLIVESAYGDAPPIDLPTLKVALEALWDAITVVSTAGGAIAFGKFVLDGLKARIRGGRGALEAGWPDLPQRLHRPDQLRRIALLRPWESKDIARLLDCETSIVEGMLRASGFDQDENGRWIVSDSEDARVLYDLLSIVNRAAKGDPADFDEGLRLAAEELLRTGSVPEERWDDEEGFWGAGATRRKRAREQGAPTDLIYFRAFCRSTRRPSLDEIQEAVGGSSRLQQRTVEAAQPPWSKALFADGPHERLEVLIELDSGDPEGLFDAEIEEFADATALSLDELRHDVLRHLYDVRMIAVIAIPPQASSTLMESAVAVVALLASTGDGLVHEDAHGWLAGGRLIET